MTLESSLLSDMERLQLEMRRIETEGQARVEELLESKRATRQDVQRLWDSVNDLQESGNATQRAVEEMYDKAGLGFELDMNLQSWMLDFLGGFFKRTY